ncbi:MAG: M12 family metallo-peptidase [Flavisolibacter sp.]
MKAKFTALIFLCLFAGCKKSDLLSPEALHDRAVGASAHELLSADTYTSLKIEFLYMSGFAPDAAALDHLQNFLSTSINKPGGISITTTQIAGSANEVLTTDQVVNLEKQNRTAFSAGNQIAVCIIYTNGSFTQDAVLGMAYRNTSAVLFGKKIHDNSGGIGQSSRTKLEATVLEHEIGHLLGLVDLGSSMQTPHKDAANGNHCSNSNCLMYYAAETTDILGFLVTGNIPSPDANCLADLHANGGK